MKQTLEEAEKEYCEKNYPYSDLNIRLLVENAFEVVLNGNQINHLG